MNKYYIIEKTNPNYADIMACIVGAESTQRTSLDGLKVVVKLPKGDAENHTCLDGSTMYSHQDILVVMQSAEWYNDSLDF